MFEVEVKVAESRWIAPETIGDDEGFPEGRGGSKGDVEEVSCVFSGASWG